MDARSISLRLSLTPDLSSLKRVCASSRATTPTPWRRVFLKEEQRIYPEALNAVARSLRAADAPET